MRNRFANYDPAIAAGFVASWEGFRGDAYLCPAGVWTIGFGHTLNVRKGMSISHSEAWTLLVQDLTYAQKTIAPLVDVLVTPGQFVALLSFAYNLGAGALRDSTLRKMLNAGDFEGASKQFGRWVFAGGVKLRGLERRREAERQLFTGETNV